MKQKNKEPSRKSLLTILAVSIVAVILIPMLYSSIYLSAFWDTYGKLNNVPVAFANLDKPVSKDGKDYNIGKEVEDNLKDNDKVKWSFVSHETAKNGVEGTDYYAMIIIPEDFSQKIADSKDGKFNKPEVIYEANKGRNYVFSQLSEKIAQSIKEDIASNIQEETSKVLVDNLYEVKDSIGNASDGANKLQDGTQKLAEGSGELSKGIANAAEGSKQLKDGLKQAANGEKQISTGTDSLIGGLNQLKSSLTEKNDNIGQLVNGANSVASGAKDAANGAKNAADGAALIHGKAEEAKAQLSTGLNNAATGVKQISDGIDSADALIASALANHEANGGFSETDIENIKKAQKIISATKNKDINNTIVVPLRSSARALEPLVDKLSELQTGTEKVASGTAQLAGGTSQVAEGTMQLANTLATSMSKAAAATDQLIAGATQLKDGSTQILNGLNTAALKTGELSNGLFKVEDGAKNLNDGLKEANDGSFKLKDSLSSGYNKINDNLKFTSEDMSKFVSEPVALEESIVNNVKYYGEGLAPYFISLSLWLGAMFINLVLSITKRLNIIRSKFLKSFTGKLAAGSTIAIVQAVLVSFALAKGLNIDVVNMTYFYLNNMLISVVFFSIIYGVSYAIGIIGTPIMFIIFLFQLASSGGTFPIETAPKFFRIIGSYIPMTYSIGTLRMIIGGVNPSLFRKDIAILLTFMVAFLTVGFAVRALIKTLKKINDKDKMLDAA